MTGYGNETLAAEAFRHGIIDYFAKDEIFLPKRLCESIQSSVSQARSHNELSIVIPPHIPWDSLTASDLEECIYWLIDAMGGKDIEWRKGSIGKGAPDGGRDIEAYFYHPGPDESIEKDKWWFEVKYRTGTVEPSVVKDSIINAMAEHGLKTLVIATNSTFSNPTRDWIRQWQKEHPFTRIRLWDRTELEKLCSRHPEVVVRLFRVRSAR